MEGVNYTNIRERIESKYACTCDDMQVRIKYDSLKRSHFVIQCQRCGKHRGIKKTHPLVLEQTEYIPFDEELHRKWKSRMWEEIRVAYDRERNQEQNEKSKIWWHWYNQYLQSDQWWETRRLVFKRDRHTCQACLKNTSEHVHHIIYLDSYEPPVFEPLWHLIAVCTICHRLIHPHMDGDGYHEIY